MADFTLTASPLLGGYERKFGSTSLRERDELALVSLAIPLGEDKKAAAAIKKAYGLPLPSPVLSAEAGGKRLVSTTADQLMLIFEHATPDANQVVNEALNGACYTTDQTDVWIVLDLSGPLAHAALERLCPLDLHPDVFPIHSAARTTMEHMGAMVIRTGADSFLLLSASSSAASFLHAVETSLHYVS